MTTESRRSFNAQMLSSLMAYGLIEGLFGSVDHHLKRYESLSFDAAA